MDKRTYIVLNPRILRVFSDFAKHESIKRPLLVNYALVKLVHDGVGSEVNVKNVVNHYLNPLEEM